MKLKKNVDQKIYHPSQQ